MGDHQKRADEWEMLFNTYRVAIELIRRDEKVYCIIQVSSARDSPRLDIATENLNKIKLNAVSPAGICNSNNAPHTKHTAQSCGLTTNTVL